MNMFVPTVRCSYSKSLRMAPPGCRLTGTSVLRNEAYKDTADHRVGGPLFPRPFGVGAACIRGQEPLDRTCPWTGACGAVTQEALDGVTCGGSNIEYIGRVDRRATEVARARWVGPVGTAREEKSAADPRGRRWAARVGVLVVVTIPRRQVVAAVAAAAAVRQRPAGCRRASVASAERAPVPPRWDAVSLACTRHRGRRAAQAVRAPCARLHLRPPPPRRWRRP